MTKLEWIETCNRWKNQWTQFPPEIENDEFGISLYKFTQVLNQNLRNDDVIVADAGSNGYVLSQSLQLKDNQRFILDSGEMAMGACVGMSIGVALARENKDVICISGDGSFQVCLRELACITANQLNIKVFVWSNNGYLSIRNTAKSFYENRFFGTDNEHGLFFPKLSKIADCFNLGYLYCDKIVDLDQTIKRTLTWPGPIIAEIKCDPNQKIVPNLAMKDGKACELHDLAPWLSKEEMDKEMIKDE